MKHCIRFRYLRNCTINLPEGRLMPFIPHRTVPVTTSIPKRDGGRYTGEYHQALTAQFDLNKIHEVELLDESPKIPIRDKNISAKYYAKLVEEAHATAFDARKKNNELRLRLKGYAQPSTSTLSDGRVVEIPPAIEIIADEQEPTVVEDSAELDEVSNG